MDTLFAMGVTGWLWFLLAIMIIVAVHEYGHYIVGRLCGIHAEVFSIGFGKVLWSRADRRGTRWQIAAIPLGGYVRFLGDANAASAGVDEAALAGLSDSERRRSMPGAPLWARVLTVLAGPVFNILLTLAIFFAMVMTLGVATPKPGVAAISALPWKGELPQKGDVILGLNGQATPDYKALYAVIEDLPKAASIQWDLERGGQRLTIEGPHPQAPVVTLVMPRNAGMAAGIEVGDVITAVDGKPLHTFAELGDLTRAGNGAAMKLSLWRAGQTLEVTLTPNRRDMPLPEGGFETRWLIGLSGGSILEPMTETPSIAKAASLSVQRSWETLVASYSGLMHVVTGQISTCNLGGAITMAQTVSASVDAGWITFFGTLAMLSIAIGALNLLPIPVLDGGHLMIYAYEAVMRRKPSDVWLNRIFAIGAALVFGLMAFALMNDVTCR